MYLSILDRPECTPERDDWLYRGVALVARVGRGRAAHGLWIGDALTLCGRRPSIITTVDYSPPRFWISGIGCAACSDAWDRGAA
jgi:hypothetical protein